MPLYTFTHKDTGQKITLDRDTLPTEQEIDAEFVRQAQPAAAPAPAAPEAEKPAGERGIGTTLREMGTEVGAATAGQALGSLAGPVGTVVGGAIGGGAGNLINQLQRMSDDPKYRFKWGEFLADVGTGAIPGGGIAKTGAKAIAREAVKQGAAGAISATTQKVLDEGQLPTGQELLLATAVPAAGGAAAQKLLSGAASSVSAVRKAFAGRSKELRTFEEGAAKGLKVVPSDIDPSFGVTQLESLGGKAAVSQRTQLANQQAVNNMVKEELRIPANVELSPAATKAIRDQEGQVYAQADAVLAGTRGAKNMQDLRALRGDSQRMWDAYFNSGGKNVDAQSKAIQLAQDAADLETKIDATLRKKGRDDIADRITEARKRIAQTYNVDEMLNPGNFNADPDVALRMMKRGVPLSGNLRTLAEFKAAFPNSLRESSKVSSPDVSLLGTFAQGALGAGLGLTSGSVPTAVAGALAIPAARKGARELLLSQPMQRAAYQAALPKAAPALGVGVGETAIREASQQLGQESTAKPTPPPAAIQKLLSDPSLAKEFDAKYGVGMARRYLPTR